MNLPLRILGYTKTNMGMKFAYAGLVNENGQGIILDLMVFQRLTKIKTPTKLTVSMDMNLQKKMFIPERMDTGYAEYVTVQTKKDDKE